MKDFEELSAKDMDNFDEAIDEIAENEELTPAKKQEEVLRRILGMIQP